MTIKQTQSSQIYNLKFAYSESLPLPTAMTHSKTKESGIQTDKIILSVVLT